MIAVGVLLFVLVMIALTIRGASLADHCESAVAQAEYDAITVRHEAGRSTEGVHL